MARQLRCPAGKPRPFQQSVEVRGDHPRRAVEATRKVKQVAMHRQVSAASRSQLPRGGIADDIRRLVPVRAAEHHAAFQQSDQPVVLPRGVGVVLRRRGDAVWGAGDTLADAGVDALGQFAEQREHGVLGDARPDDEHDLAPTLCAQQGLRNVGAVSDEAQVVSPSRRSNWRATGDTSESRGIYDQSSREHNGRSGGRPERETPSYAPVERESVQFRSLARSRPTCRHSNASPGLPLSAVRSSAWTAAYRNSIQPSLPSELTESGASASGKAGAIADVVVRSLRVPQIAWPNGFLDLEMR